MENRDRAKNTPEQTKPAPLPTGVEFAALRKLFEVLSAIKAAVPHYAILLAAALDDSGIYEVVWF